MNVTFIMTADGTTLKDIRHFIKKNISQKGILDFRLSEEPSVIRMVSKSSSNIKQKTAK